MKKVIINADDFGYSEEVNEAVLYAYKEGAITSASILANMNAFNNAVFEIFPKIPSLDIGFHFNIVEGKSLTNSHLLCNSNGFFNNGFISILTKSKNKKFLQAVEYEFRMQIEKILKEINISHIDSHRHIHAIPEIFHLISDLAKEYNIKFIRTQRELPYIIPTKIFNTKFPVNIMKIIILNLFTTINKYPYTNKYFIGILYTGYMDKQSIIKGLNKIKEESITEIILHPTINKLEKCNYKELLTLKDPTLRQTITESGFELIQYSKLY